MKKIAMPLLGLVIILGLVIALVTPARADHYKYLYKGLEAQAYWYMYDEDTGIYTDISVYATDGISQNPPGSREQFHGMAGSSPGQIGCEGQCHCARVFPHRTEQGPVGG